MKLSVYYQCIITLEPFLACAQLVWYFFLILEREAVLQPSNQNVNEIYNSQTRVNIHFEWNFVIYTIFKILFDPIYRFLLLTEYFTN